MDQILFYVFAATAALSGLLAISRKNAVASACWLVVMFFGLSAIYVLLEAYFVAAVQILVYAGAIMVLFLFVIMLLDLRSSQLAAHSGPKLRVMGVVLAAAFTGVALHTIADASADPKIADRVTAALELPPPASPESANPLEVPAPAVVPAPADIELHEVAAVSAPTDLGEAPGEHRGDRTYEGRVVLGASKEPTRVDVTVSPDGALDVHLSEANHAASSGAVHVVDLTPVTPASNAPGASTSTSPTGASTTRFSIASVPGAAIAVTLQRGGLDARAGGGPDGSPQAIGKSLFEDWLLPFEIVSLLLTGAIFGAVVLTKRRLP